MNDKRTSSLTGAVPLMPTASGNMDSSVGDGVVPLRLVEVRGVTEERIADVRDVRFEFSMRHNAEPRRLSHQFKEERL